jgi:SAM-dependent methyltransferase
MMRLWQLRAIRGTVMPHPARWLELEFGWHAERVTEAGLALGLPDLVPIACRGSSHPALLDRLARLIGARPGLAVLDGGCGLGGPMAWLAREHGCSVVGVDVMASAVRGAHRLFPASTVLVASLTALPFGPGAFDAAWALGSLSTIPELDVAARELRRVLAPGGRLAVYDFVAASAIPADAPVANAFTAPGMLAGHLTAAGLTVLASGRAPSVGEAPAAWREPILAVEREIAQCHGGDPRYRLEAGERAAFGRLQLSGCIVPWLLLAERPCPS